MRRFLPAPVMLFCLVNCGGSSLKVRPPADAGTGGGGERDAPPVGSAGAGGMAGVDGSARTIGTGGLAGAGGGSASDGPLVDGPSLDQTLAPKIDATPAAGAGGDAPAWDGAGFDVGGPVCIVVEETSVATYAIDPACKIVEFAGVTWGGAGYGIASGRDGNLWVTEESAIIRRVTPEFGSTGYTAGSGARLGGIVASTDGMWFTDSGNGAIGRVSPAGSVTSFPLPNRYTYPDRIAAGPDGDLWFTQRGARSIGRMSPTGKVTEYVVPSTNAIPRGIAVGTDGNIWFTESVSTVDGGAGLLAGKIAKITTDGVITEFPLPAGATAVRAIAAGPDGNLWFTENNGIGRITPAGVVTEFPLPQPGSDPWAIAAGPDSNLWFTEFTGRRIGRITADGVITEAALSDLSQTCHPMDITAGPDGNLWFTFDCTARIGRLTP